MTSCDYWKPIKDGGIALPCNSGRMCDDPAPIAPDDAPEDELTDDEAEWLARLIGKALSPIEAKP